MESCQIKYNIFVTLSNFNLLDFRSMKRVVRFYSSKPKINLFFDVDATIYPESINLHLDIDKGVNSFLENLLGMTQDEASKTRERLFHQYGSTYLGLNKEYEVDVDFVKFCDEIFHQVDTKHILETRIDENHRKEILEMFNAFDREKVRMFVFSNGTKSHVDNVLEFFEIEEDKGLFDEIVTIEDMSDNQNGEHIIHKPDVRSFEAAARITGVEIGEDEEIYFFDDHKGNIAQGQEFGWNCVFVNERGENHNTEGVVSIKNLIEVKELFPEFFKKEKFQEI